MAGESTVAPRGEESLSGIATVAKPASQRLVSLDALRGFTMFWITGGREFLLGLVAWGCPEFYDVAEWQLTHPIWRGFVAWDMVMPLFLFVVGAAMPLAMAKRATVGQPLWRSYLRIFRRVALLWVLGIIAQEVKYLPPNFELYSNALQAIAVGYLVTAVAMLHLQLRGQVALLVLLLLVFAGLLLLVPFDGQPAGTLERQANLARYVDVQVLGPYRRLHSFTWVVSSLGFAASVLLGAVAGQLLMRPLSAGRRVLWFLSLGVGCMAIGWIWSYWLPLNRHLWTSSMVLWSGGMSFLILALFYAVIDVAGYRRWAFPFVVIGANALLAYVFDPAFEHLGNEISKLLLGSHRTVYVNLLSSGVEIVGLWIVLWYLYRNRMFLRA